MNRKITFLTKGGRQFCLGSLITLCLISWIMLPPRRLSANSIFKKSVVENKELTKPKSRKKPIVGQPLSYAEQRLDYKTYHPRTREIVNRFSVLKEDMPDGGYKIHWVSEEGEFKIKEAYILNADFETIWWQVIDVQRKTDYTGEKTGNQIFIRGQFKGGKVEKVIPLDERPFYYNPKFGLVNFVRSGKKSGKFLGFRHDELKEYPMKAVNKGVEMVTVNGQDVKAVRVHWTVDDFRSTFFKRVYWFRESDGLYIKQKVSGGMFRELVSE